MIIYTILVYKFEHLKKTVMANVSIFTAHMQTTAIVGVLTLKWPAVFKVVSNAAGVALLNPGWLNSLTEEEKVWIITGPTMILIILLFFVILVTEVKHNQKVGAFCIGIFAQVLTLGLMSQWKMVWTIIVQESYQENFALLFGGSLVCFITARKIYGICVAISHKSFLLWMSISIIETIIRILVDFVICLFIWRDSKTLHLKILICCWWNVILTATAFFWRLIEDKDDPFREKALLPLIGYYADDTPRWRYVMWARQICVATVVVQCKSSPILQAVTFLVVYTGSLVLHLHYYRRYDGKAPYPAKYQNKLSLSLLVSSLVTVVGGMIFYAYPSEVTGVIVAAIPVCSMVFSLFYLCGKKIKRFMGFDQEMSKSVRNLDINIDDDNDGCEYTRLDDDDTIEGRLYEHDAGGFVAVWQHYLFCYCCPCRSNSGSNLAESVTAALEVQEDNDDVCE